VTSKGQEAADTVTSKGQEAWGKAKDGASEASRKVQQGGEEAWEGAKGKAGDLKGAAENERTRRGMTLTEPLQGQFSRWRVRSSRPGALWSTRRVALS